MYSDKSKGKFCSTWFGNEINDFKNEFQKMNFNKLDENSITILKNSEENYFIHFYSICKQVVYEGYPVSSDEFDFEVVSLLHSYEKMNLITSETVAFHNFTEYITENFSSKYKFIKYLFLAGF